MKLRNLVGTGILLLLLGCAMVTVNVYFPEEDVKMAYDMMEEEFMRQHADTRETEEGIDSSMNLVPARSEWSLVTPAEADDEVRERTITTEKILEVLRTMPDVVAAYERRGGRLDITEELLASSVIGIDRNGLVDLLPTEIRNPESNDVIEMLILDSGDDIEEIDEEVIGDWLADQLAEENHDRQIIISGMAEAMMQLLYEDEEGIEDEATLRESMKRQSRKMFAEREMENAPYGWWVQLPDQEWYQLAPPVIDVDDEQDDVGDELDDVDEDLSEVAADLDDAESDPIADVDDDGTVE